MVRLAEGNAAGESFRDTKRWFRKHPELGPAGISTEAFWSQEQFDLERERLWPHVWLMVGRAEEIPGVGDFLIKDIPSNSVSLVVVRGRDGKIRAFHNVCPHRGTQLCWGKHGSVAAFTCPYHGFTFNLEGRLTFVPDEANFYDLDKSQLGLTSVVTDTWEGFIFVHLDPNPKETLREFIGDEVAKSVADFPFHERTRFHEYKAVLNCNWKVLMAAFLEAFKGPTLHPRSANRVFSSENPFAHNDHINLLERHRIIQLYSSPTATPTRTGAVAYRRRRVLKPGIQVEDETGQDGSYGALNKRYLIHNMFPNFQLNLVRGNWLRHQLWPLSADRVLWEVRFYFEKPKRSSDLFFQDYSRLTSRDNLMADVQAAERSQTGLAAGLSRRWNLQDEEIAIQHFMKVVSSYVTAGQQNPEVSAVGMNQRATDS